MKRLVATYGLALLWIAAPAAGPLELIPLAHAGPTQQTTNHVAQTSQPRQLYTPELPLFAEGSTTAQRAESKNYAEAIKTANDDLTIQIAAAAALCTFLLVATGVAQLFLFYRQLKLIGGSAEDAKNAAVAAQTSANAAKAQAEAMVLAQRAWVVYTRMDRASFTNGTILDENGVNGIQFSLVWVNGGQTPAFQTEIYVEWRVVAGDAGVPLFRPPAAAENPEAKSTTVAPGGYAVSQPCYLTESKLKKLVTGEVRYFFFGRADYRDIFTEQAGRHTQVCIEVSVNGEEITPTGERRPRLSFIAVGPQNTAN